MMQLVANVATGWRPRKRWMALAAWFFLPLLVSTAQEGTESKGASATPYRTWTDVSGKYRRTARLINLGKEQVTLQIKDGATVEISRDQLSEIDRAYLDGIEVERSAKADKPALTFVDVGPPNPNCETCRGLGLVPLRGLTALVHVYSDGDGPGTANKARSQPIASCCPACQAGRDPLTLNASHEMDPAAALDKHRAWERVLGQKMLRVDTHYLTILSQLSKSETIKLARGLEKFEQLMQKQLGTMALSNRRRGVDEFLVFDGKENYQDFVRILESRDTSGNDWRLAYETVSSTYGHITYCCRESPASPLVSQAVFASAFAQMNWVVLWDKAPWLHAGFASYYESAVTKKNVSFMAGYRYEKGQQVPSLRNAQIDASNWDRVIRQVARQNQLTSWDAMFVRQYGDYQPIHDVQAKSMVTFLLREPARFMAFVDLLKVKDQGDALSEAYGVHRDELEAAWVKWLK